jgi:DNA-binding transcriptional LysR family regulator
MDKLDAMRAFVNVVAHSSYAEAGRTLGLTRSAISKAVQELEHLLGARLLDRTTRKVSATEAGLAYYESAVDILARVEETELKIASLHDEPRGVLKINAPVSFGVLHLAPVLARFMASYPDLKIEATLNDRFIDPIEEGVDVTIRIGALASSSLIARKLAPARRVLIASPNYLTSAPNLETADDLINHRCLSYGHTTTLQNWQLLHNGETINAPIHSVMCSNNGDVLRDAAILGQGIAMLPTFLVGPDLKSGRLTVVLSNHPPTDLGIYALYAPNRYLAAKTRLLIDHLAQSFGDKPAWD